MNKLMNSDPHRVLIDVFDRGRRLCSEDLFHCVTLERKEGKRFGYKLERLENKYTVGFKRRWREKSVSDTFFSGTKQTGPRDTLGRIP